MRGITKRIFFAVIIAAIISFGCFFVVLMDMEDITNRYNNLIDGYIENRRILSEINQRMYRIQAQVASHVVNSDDSRNEIYEKQVEELDKEIRELFRGFESRLTSVEEKDLFRQVTNSYNGFDTQIDIALKFSRDGAFKSAEYYVCTVMEEHLEEANDAFNMYYERTKKVVDAAKEDMEEELAQIRIWRNGAIVVIVIVLLACLIIVYRSGRKIVNRQLMESYENNQRIMDMQYKTIVGMANLIESRDGETGEHVKRTSAYAEMIAEELSKEVSYREVINTVYMENLWKAAPLHDIGKIKISDTILQKPGKLTDEEFERMKMHASEGGKIIDVTMGAIDDREYLDMAHQVARYHHEKWDGSGYPDGLRGEEIPLCARIMAVADVFDALISKRCYKKAMSVEKAYSIIEESSGSHFDPVVAQAFIRIRPRVEAYLRNEETEEIRF